MPADILRTSDGRFAALPGYPFAPHYVDVPDARHGRLRMHYVDEGPHDAPVVLMLHGEPTWSFLYRKMIPLVASAGYRAVAPDMIGFGRSDKLARRDGYSYQRFVDWMASFVTSLDLRRITLVCQDWGGPIGLRVLARMPERFAAVVAANTLLPNCEPPPNGIEGWPGPGIENWVATCRNADDLPISEIVAGVCRTRPGPDILAGYDAPFPDASYKAAALAITGLIPIRTDMPGVAENREAWRVIANFTGPFVTAFSDCDPSTKPWEKLFQRRVAGAKNQPHVEIANAGHFLQEEQGERLADTVLTVMDHLYR